MVNAADCDAALKRIMDATSGKQLATPRQPVRATGVQRVMIPLELAWLWSSAACFSWPALAASMYRFDLQSLAYMSTAVIEGDVTADKSHRVTC